MVITATDLSVVVATIGQVYTTVVAGPSGPTTLTAVKQGASITGSASAMLSTTEVVQADGSTSTFTVFAQASASSGATTYTVIQTDISGTLTRTVVGVNPEETQPPASLQNEAVLAGSRREMVLMAAMLLISVSVGILL
jgi:hypothetical protein